MPEWCALPVTDNWEVQPGKPTYTANVNVAMASVTGCEIKSDCPTGMTPDAFFEAVAVKLREDHLCAGLAKPGEDQIVVGATPCGWQQAFHIYNYGGGKIVWAPGSFRDTWRAVGGGC